MIRNIIIQIIFFVLIFNLLSWYKESSMLSKDTHISSEDNTLTALTGEKVELFSNNKNTIIYFFAPWCQVCHFSIENLQEFSNDNPDYNVVAVALDYMEQDEVADFVQEHQLRFPIALGNEKIKQQFRISGYPSYYVVDKNNQVIGKSLGYSTKIGMYLRTI